MSRTEGSASPEVPSRYLNTHTRLSLVSLACSLDAESPRGAGILNTELTLRDVSSR